jgi:hypothetical protein
MNPSGKATNPPALSATLSRRRNSLRHFSGLRNRCPPNNGILRNIRNALFLGYFRYENQAHGLVKLKNRLDARP